jgi:hypothetical protein
MWGGGDSHRVEKRRKTGLYLFEICSASVCFLVPRKKIGVPKLKKWRERMGRTPYFTVRNHTTWIIEDAAEVIYTSVIITDVVKKQFTTKS